MKHVFYSYLRASYRVSFEKSPGQELASHHSENPAQLAEKLNSSIHAYQLPPVQFEELTLLLGRIPTVTDFVGCTRAEQGSLLSFRKRDWERKDGRILGRTTLQLGIFH